MTDFIALEQQLREALDLTRPPIAISFPTAPPAGVEKFAGSELSGCSFWRQAAEDRVFYTEPSDHMTARSVLTRTRSICRPIAPANYPRFWEP